MRQQTSMSIDFLTIGLAFAFALAAGSSALAQNQPETTDSPDTAVSTPVANEPGGADQAAADDDGPIDERMDAEIIRVTGKVQHGPPAGNGETKWTDAKIGDTLPAGTRIKTSLRSSVVLRFGDDTVAVVDRMTLASIDQFHRTGDTKKVQLGLGYGLIRGAVRETTLRSDMTIESPTATLSKKGTIDFGMWAAAGSDRYRIFLNDKGLIEAFSQATGKRLTVQTGEYVTQAMLLWVDTALRNRQGDVLSQFGLTSDEEWYNALYGSGRGVVDPGSGFSNFTGRTSGAVLGPSVLRNQLPNVPQTIGRGFGPDVIVRPEGNFGTGRGRVPKVLLDQ